MNMNKMRRLLFATFAVVGVVMFNSCSSSSTPPFYKLKDIEFVHEDGDALEYFPVSKEGITIANHGTEDDEFGIYPFYLAKGGYLFKSEDKEAFTLKHDPIFVNVPQSVNINQGIFEDIFLTKNKYPYVGTYVENDMFYSDKKTILVPAKSKAITTVNFKMEKFTVTYYATFRDVYSHKEVVIRGKFTRDTPMEVSLATTIKPLDEENGNGEGGDKSTK